MLKVKRYPLKRRSDERGWLLQNDYPELAEKIKHFILSTTKPGGIRGNHYHNKKREWFCIAKGNATLYLYDPNTKEKVKAKLSGDKPELIEVDPGIVHTLINDGDSEMIFFEIIDHPFNEKDTDTYPYKLK